MIKSLFLFYHQSSWYRKETPYKEKQGEKEYMFVGKIINLVSYI